MMKNSYKMIFISSLILGTLISISSSSWFSVWMGLEINLLSFIPICMNSNNLFNSEASLKYFLTQALASAILLFSIIMFYLINSSFYEIEKINLINFNMLMNMILASSLMMKSGVAPFHFWFPNVMEGLNWINNFILMTWQKIAPLIILSMCISFKLLVFCIIISIFTGAMGGLNQTSLRKLMAFSSINHLGWLISNLMNNENLFMIYMIFYIFLSFSIIFIFYNFNIFNLNQMFNLKFKNKIKKFWMGIPLLSLGGLPPLLGFFPKWITIELLINTNFFLLVILLINFTLITLYFYIRIIFSSLLINHNNMNWNFSWMMINKKTFNLMNFIIYCSLLGLMFINFLFIFY